MARPASARQAVDHCTAWQGRVHLRWRDRLSGVEDKPPCRHAHPYSALAAQMALSRCFVSGAEAFGERRGALGHDAFALGQ